jgi:hypothetical protein
MRRGRAAKQARPTERRELHCDQRAQSNSRNTQVCPTRRAWRALAGMGGKLGQNGLVLWTGESPRERHSPAPFEPRSALEGARFDEYRGMTIDARGSGAVIERLTVVNSLCRSRAGGRVAWGFGRSRGRHRCLGRLRKKLRQKAPILGADDGLKHLAQHLGKRPI